MRVFPELTQDGEFNTLGDLGYSGSFNDRQFAYLRSEGFTGSLSDMFYSFLSNTLSEFAFGGVEPSYLLDFVNDPAGAESALTFSRASTALMRNSSGEWVSVAIDVPRIGHHEWNGSAWINKGLLVEGQSTNLKIGLATESVTVTSGQTYTLSVHGSASAVLSDAGTGTATDGSHVTFTASSTTATVTVSGSAVDDIIQLELGGEPTSPIPTTSSQVTRAADVMTQPAGTLTWPTPEVIGPELVTNGTFDTDLTGWTTTSADWNWHSSGRVHLDTTTNYQILNYDTDYTSGGMQAGKLYLIEFDYELVSGSFRFSLSSVNSYNTIVNTLGSGRFSLVVIRPADNRSDEISIRNETPTTELFIDNISVREINPLALTIGMSGEVSYSDNDQPALAEGGGGEVSFLSWKKDNSNYIETILATVSDFEGAIAFRQNNAAVLSQTFAETLSPGLNVPFNYCVTHASTFVAAAVNGVALTTNTTPTALPDLSATEVDLLPTFNGTVEWIAYWSEDIGDAGRLEGSSYGS